MEVNRVSTKSSSNDAVGKEFELERTPLRRIQMTLHRYPWLSSLIVLLAVVIAFGTVNERFLLPSTISLMVQQTVIVGSLAIAQALIILTAGIDLSIGSMMIFGQMLMANMAVLVGASFVLPIAGQNPYLAIAVGILAATAAGAINGFLIVRFGLPPFIVTLGTWSVFMGLTLIFFKARTIQGPEMPDVMLFLGEGFPIGPFFITYGLVVMFAMYFVVAWVLRNTAWGKHVYAVGDDPQAAQLSGINTNRVLFSVYLVAGLIIGITAVITIGRVGSASPNVDPMLNLQSITAVVIGGISLFGGRGAVVGALIGSLIVVAVEMGLSLAGVDQAYRTAAIGVLVIVAVGIDQWIRKVKV
ncbi:MAG: ABC transporter permease [Microbacteriaceae bacterium]|nr:ABC transporter permease [Microbacteriaceae bacterium]